MKTSNTTLDDIAAVIGFTATVRLSAWFGEGSQNLYVPKKMGKENLLAKLIGLPAASRMVAEWPDTYLAVPSMNAFEEDSRTRFICRLLEKGFGTKEIARRLRLSERRVQQVMRDLERMGLIEIVLPEPVGRPLTKAGRHAAPKIAVDLPPEIAGVSPEKIRGKAVPRLRGVVSVVKRGAT